MALVAGSRIGPYEVVSPLGAGGMGEVYKAKDTRLGRLVAIKVLLGHHAEDPTMRERFEREARAISALSHPSICTLYDVGEHEGTHFLVMEYLEGETLAARLARVPLPLEQALKLGSEIALALSVAHARGIVHRDLKPGNVMLTRSGVKLLDFGLAKLHAASHGITDLGAQETASAPLTERGMVLGTLQYMAPEQLEGKDADARSDIFALGCVMYEMATGKKAFEGANRAAVISAILSSDPKPVSTVQPLSPLELDRVVAACLAKDPGERWQSARDVARELGWVGATPAAGGKAPAPARARARIPSLVAAAAIGALVAALGAVALRPRPGPAEAAKRFAVQAPPGCTVGDGVALSPDGRRLAFTATDAAGKRGMWLRTFDSLSPRLLDGTEGARFPFWSPDGRWIAFFQDRRLRRVDADTGDVQTIAMSAGWGLGGAWGRAGTILYCPAFGAPLTAIPASGGAATLATTIDTARGEAAHMLPAFLPDGRHCVFVARNLDPEQTTVCLGELGSTTTRPLFRADSTAVYADPGYLLFAREGALMAQRFDPDRLEVVGEPVVAAENVLFFSTFSGLAASASADGTLVYGLWSHRKRLVWVDRKRQELGMLGPIGDYDDVAISPDGRRVACSMRDPARGQNLDVWVLDVARGTGSRVSTERTDEFQPVWYPDGGRVLYASDHAGFYGLYSRPWIGGSESVMLRTNGDPMPWDISPDGSSMVFGAVGTQGEPDAVLYAPLKNPADSQRLAGPAGFDRFQARLSPDGRWIAFVSDESGRSEVYVQPFPTGAKVQVSAGGGDVPVWRRDGREIFYVSPDDKLTAVELRMSGADVEVTLPAPLFDLKATGSQHLEPRQYDVAPGGDRFIVVRRAEGAEPDSLVVALNWTRGLRK